MESTLLSKLTSKSGRCTVEAKVLRIWKSVNPKANNQLICHDILLVDIEGNAIQAVIKPADMYLFESILQENQVFKISNFFVTEKKKLYNVIPIDHKINFARTTIVARSKVPPENFPGYHFNFATLEQLKERVNSNETLSDVIGQVMSIGKAEPTFVGRIYQQVTRRNIQIRLLEDESISVTLWAEFADELQHENLLYKNDKPIVIFAAMTVTKFMGQLSISTCSASRIILNPDIPEATEMKIRNQSETEQVQLLESHGSSRLPPSEEKEINRKTILQLLQLDPAEALNKKYTCKAKIIDIDASQGWFYNACNECNKTMTPLDGIFWCFEHNEKIPTPRCKLSLTIDDATAIMPLMFFGDPEHRLVKKPMMNLIAMANGDPYVLPEPLRDLENKTKIFQVSMSRQAIDQSGKKFSITNVFDLEESAVDKQLLMLPGPTEQMTTLKMKIEPTSTKRKLDEKEDGTDSPTKMNIPTDLFPNESPAKVQKKSKGKKIIFEEQA